MGMLAIQFLHGAVTYRNLICNSCPRIDRPSRLSLLLRGSGTSAIPALPASSRPLPSCVVALNTPNLPFSVKHGKGKQRHTSRVCTGEHHDVALQLQGQFTFPADKKMYLLQMLSYIGGTVSAWGKHCNLRESLILAT